MNMSCARPYREALERLRSTGLRPTRQRLALAKLLFGSADRHVTAEMLHSEAMAAEIPVSLATVYNTLHQFTEAGLLREVVVDSARCYFDTNTSYHHHFFHSRSGLLTDIPGTELALVQVPAAPPGVRISRVDIIVRIED
jgi:Fur family transcriptional regulator, iron response regulator